MGGPGLEPPLSDQSGLAWGWGGSDLQSTERRRALEGERAAATTLREYKEYEDKEAIMGEVRHGMGRERKGEKENQGTEQKTNIKRLVDTGTERF